MVQIVTTDLQYLRHMSRASQTHVTVLLEEAVNALNLKGDSVVIDATLGAGGHTARILETIGAEGSCLSLDADKTAIKAFQAVSEAKNLTLIEGNFKDIVALTASHLPRSADGILADLGWRQEQFSGGGKGFSFKYDEPLLMTFGDPEQYSFTARDIVNDWEEEVLANIIYGYGEDRFARRIARTIVASRQEAPITTSLQLAEVVSTAVPTKFKHGKIHPATKTFQALRIAVNDELSVLETFITDACDLLAPGGRLAIITFHSLEDRIVKHAFRTFAHDQKGTVITKKPITATDAEVAENPRSRSAKLRVFERHIL